MPCDQNITNQIEFKSGTDMDLMKQALEAAGYVAFEYQGGLAFYNRAYTNQGGKFVDGAFTLTEGTEANPIKRAYSTLAVKAAAKKHGWRVSIDAKNPNKMQIHKRS